MRPSVQLATYNNSCYNPGRSLAWRAAWLFIGLPVLRCGWLPSSGLRVALLRMFGARIGRGVVVHSDVSIKYPWHLVLGDDCWIGERCWIDNLTTVRLGSNVCVSQGAYLCTGNHDWKDPSFGLRVEPIHIHDGAWVGAKATLLPGTTMEQGAIASAGSVIAGCVPAFEIFAGNPARFIRKRELREQMADATVESVR